MLGAQTLPLLMLYHLPNPPCWICLSEIHCLIRTAKDITDSNINIWIWPCVALFRVICYIVNCWYPFKKLTQESSPLYLESKVYFWTSFDVGLIWRVIHVGKIFKSKQLYIAPFIKEMFDFKTNKKKKKSTTENAHKKHVLFHSCTFSDANEKTSFLDAHIWKCINVRLHFHVG